MRTLTPTQTRIYAAVEADAIEKRRTYLAALRRLATGAGSKREVDEARVEMRFADAYLETVAADMDETAALGRPVVRLVGGTAC